MPIFEFVCDNCGEAFEELLRSSSVIGEVICPSCHSEQVKKKISTFASKTTGASSGANSFSTAACSTGSV